LRKDEEPDTFNCEPPLCSDCGQMDCICEPEKQECPGSVCFECGQFNCICLPDEEPDETEEDQGEDHD